MQTVSRRRVPNTAPDPASPFLINIRFGPNPEIPCPTSTPINLPATASTLTRYLEKPSYMKVINKLSYFIALFLLVLINIGKVLNVQIETYAEVMVVVLLTGLTLVNLLVVKFNKLKYSKWQKILLSIITLYIFWLVFNLFRTSAAGYIPLNVGLKRAVLIVLPALFLFLLLTNQPKYQNIANGIQLLAGMLGVYIVANCLLYMIGIKNDSLEAYLREVQYSKLMLFFFNVQTNLIVFPLTSGLNYFGTVCGVGVVANTAAATKAKNVGVRFFYYFVVLVAIGCMVVTNSRASLILSLATSALIKLHKLNIYKWFAFGVPFVILLPVFLTGLLRAYADSSLGQFFEHTGGQFDTASGRVPMWNAAFDIISKFKLTHLYGYGAYGHMLTGAVYIDANELIGNRGGFGKSFHNASIQNLIDNGYIGYLLYVSYLGLLFAYTKIDVHKILHPVLIFMVLIGVMESAGTIYQVEFLIAFVLFGLIFAISQDSVQKKNREHTDTMTSKNKQVAVSNV